MQCSDYYKVLGLHPTASNEEIKAAYRALVRRYHPDLNTEPGAEEALKAIVAAYEVLGDPQRRANYDRLSLYFDSQPKKAHIEKDYASPKRGAGLRALYAYLLLLCVGLILTFVWQYTTPERQARQWKMRPMVKTLAVGSHSRSELKISHGDADSAYLRRCVLEHRAHPNDPAATERLAAAYVAAGRKLLAAGENDRAFTFAALAYSVMDGKCQTAEALMRDIRRAQGGPIASR